MKNFFDYTEEQISSIWKSSKVPFKEFNGINYSMSEAAQKELVENTKKGLFYLSKSLSENKIYLTGVKVEGSKILFRTFDIETGEPPFHGKYSSNSFIEHQDAVGLQNYLISVDPATVEFFKLTKLFNWRNKDFDNLIENEDEKSPKPPINSINYFMKYVFLSGIISNTKISVTNNFESLLNEEKIQGIDYFVFEELKNYLINKSIFIENPNLLKLQSMKIMNLTSSLTDYRLFSQSILLGLLEVELPKRFKKYFENKVEFNDGSKGIVEDEILFIKLVETLLVEKILPKDFYVKKVLPKEISDLL